jgi:uncharacterized protein YunC (DUF1805 family)
MQIETIELNKGNAIGLKWDMEHAPLLIIKAPRGFVMCGYLNMVVAEQLGDVAAKVTGVRNFDDVLTSRVVEVSSAAMELGIKVGMTAFNALDLMY